MSLICLAVEGRDPMDDYYQICKKLDLTAKEFLHKPRILPVANKMDLPRDAKKICQNSKRQKSPRTSIAISAKDKEGLDTNFGQRLDYVIIIDTHL